MEYKRPDLPRCHRPGLDHHLAATTHVVRTGAALYRRRVTVSFRLLRDALSTLALDPDQQRRALAGTAVTDELALDLDNAVTSLNHEMQRTGIDLDPELLTALTRLNDTLAAPPADSLWDEDSLDIHPVWAAARETAYALLTQLPTPTTTADFGDMP